MPQSTLKVAAFGMVCAVFAGYGMTQDPQTKPAIIQGGVKPDDRQGAGTPAGAVKDWEQLVAPRPEHKLLEPLAGTWNMIVKSRTDPAGPWEQTQGVARYRLIMGGRFVVEETQCQFQGTTFEWMGIYGFDPAKKRYTAAWVDNFGFGMDVAECKADPTGRVFAFEGRKEDPQGGGMATFKWIITIKNKDEVQIEMFEAGPDGKDAKVMEIAQTRAT